MGWLSLSRHGLDRSTFDLSPGLVPWRQQFVIKFLVFEAGFEQAARNTISPLFRLSLASAVTVRTILLGTYTSLPDRRPSRIFSPLHFVP